jgi:hypothetical protein
MDENENMNSDFIVENAFQMPTELLSDEGTISLNNSRWRTFSKSSITRRPRASRPCASYSPNGQSSMAETGIQRCRPPRRRA